MNLHLFKIRQRLLCGDSTPGKCCKVGTHAMPCEHGSVFSENCLITNEIIRHSSRACRHCLDDNHLIQGAYNSGKPGKLREFHFAVFVSTPYLQ